MKKILVITTAATILASGAVIAKPGTYIGANLGIGGIQTKKMDTEGLSNYKFNINGLAGRVNAGHLFGQNSFNYGIEVGYAMYQSNKYTIGDTASFIYKGYNIDILGVAQYNFNSNWNIFSKAGVAYVHQKTTTSEDKFFNPYTDSKNKFLPEVAIGGGYEFDNGLGLNLTFSHIFGNNPEQFNSVNMTRDNLNKVASVNMLTLGINYKF
jgi:outer membrane immunogenic protein